MKFSKQSILAPSALMVVLSIALPASAATVHHAQPAPPASKFVQTDMALRDLWLEHVFWTRNVTLETLAGNAAGAAAAEQNVVKNAKNIAAAMEPFYGKAASEKLFDLLAGHYTAVKHYLEAVHTNNPQEQDTARERMAENAEKIAVFLSSANPNLPTEALRGMLLAHGGHHIQQIQQLRDKQYNEEAQTWDTMKNHMYAIADALAGALAKQFPAKFR